MPSQTSIRVRPAALLAVGLVLSLGSVAVLAASPLTGPGGSAPASSPPASAASSDQGLPASQPPAPAGPASGKPDADPPEVGEPSEKPEVDTEDSSAAGAVDAIDRLAAAGIKTTPGVFQRIAAIVGVGGAVRVLAFANASGKTPDQILAMFQGGMGWGQIRKNLHLSIGPGIGSIMGQGHGNGAAKGKPSKPAKP